jgi:uncharacterized protein
LGTGEKETASMARKPAKKNPSVRTICHIEIPAPNIRKAIAFYTKVFGWEIEEPQGMGGYAFWRTEGNSGGFDPGMRPAARDGAGVGLVLAVASIPRKLQQIVRAGGKVVKEKTPIGGGYGFYASFLDPNGNRLSIWTRK